MQFQCELKQPRYWLYVNDNTKKYACLRDEKPYKLAVFETEEDGAAFVEAYTLMASLRGHWVDKSEVLVIANLDFDGNYVVLNESDIFLIKSRTEQKYSNRTYGNIPEG